MLLSNIIQIEEIFKNEEKELFNSPKEKCSLHNMPLIFFKTNSSEKPFYCHECINKEYDIINNNKKEDNSTLHSFIRIDDINKIYHSKMKELIKLRENEQNFKQLSEKYNQFGNYLVEFIVKETKKFINQLIIKNCSNEKNDFFSEKNIQIQSSVNFINSSEKVINDAKSIECKALNELNFLQNKFINSKYDLIDGIQKVCSDFFESNILVKREKKEMTFEENLDCLFSKFENSNNINKENPIDFNDKKTQNQSSESNKNSNSSSQVKSNNFTSKINSTLLFPIIRKNNNNLIIPKPFDDENKDKDFAFPNASNISINNSDSSLSIENNINNCLSKKEENEEKEHSKNKENEEMLNKIIKKNSNSENINNIQNSHPMKYKIYNNFNDKTNLKSNNTNNNINNN